jgi:aryl-alcohol dehydrogenase-like predicted oxidoreductase
MMASRTALLLAAHVTLAAAFAPIPTAPAKLVHGKAAANRGPRALSGLTMAMDRISRRQASALGGAAVAGALWVPSASIPANAATTTEKVAAVPLAPVEFGKIGGEMDCAKVLTGMWQLSGSHGYRPSKDKVVKSMKEQVEAGFTTFDLADHYGPAEQMTALFKKQHPELWAKSQFFTKWVPMPGDMSRKVVEAAIDTRLQRMGTDRLDMLQFHWWDYGSRAQYMEALGHMQDMVTEGKIRHLALTNFDTENLKAIKDAGIKVVSNQVQYSVLDKRPAALMGPYCEKNDVKILAYGTVLGGFLSDKYVGKALDEKDFDTVSKRKYYNMIRQWGSWELFQELLAEMKSVADKHQARAPRRAKAPSPHSTLISVRQPHATLVSDVR